MLGVAAAEVAISDVLLAGLAGLVAGALSMAAGEYVSVSSQADTENADLDCERRALAAASASSTVAYSSRARNDADITTAGIDTMKRRDVLVALGAAMTGLAAQLHSQAGRARRLFTRDLPAHDQPAALLTEIERLEARQYSEQGIPMLLACENLAGSQPATAETTGRALAGLYSQYAILWPQLREDLSEYDAATLVELLAEHDFANGGRGIAP